MTLRDCYGKLHGDYDEVLSRLRSERLVQKFVLKFPDDKSFEALEAAMGSHDRETAFRAAHTIKGMCQNLSFTKLGDSSHELTEALRNEWSDSVPVLFEAVKADYELTAGAIREFGAGLGL